MAVRTALAAAFLLAAVPALAGETLAGRQIETLDRGLVAVPSKAEGMQISWRLLGSDPADIAFNLYRDGRKLNISPITASTNWIDTGGTAASRYTVRTVMGSREGRASKAVTPWASGYLSIPLDPPAGSAGVTYNANDASAGDLDGDGRYEIILKWDPSDSQDNAFAGVTSPTYFDAYTLEGRRLWRINMGRNIRSGAHYSQFLVFDFDGDGRSELVVKTADGTVDGKGKVIGDPKADWRSRAGFLPSNDRTGGTSQPDGKFLAQIEGRILSGPEYLTVFDGRTGAALATAPYRPGRHPDTDSPTPDQLKAVWGDGYGNRSDRFLAGVAYLDGKHPSIVMARGYYGRSTLAAWDWRGGKLIPRWLFDSAAPGNQAYGGQGNHQLSVADLDGDGRDEILYGSMAVDDNGKGLWTARLFHGDAMHLGDLDPGHPGLEKFGVHETPSSNGGIGAAMLDAKTGAVLWSTPATTDIGRGSAFDIDPRHPGAEAWATNSPNLYDARGKVISAVRPRQVNFGLWWDGDLLRELLDGVEISKWDWRTNTTATLLKADGMASNNGTKATPALAADILGDWREEVIWRAADNLSLRIYATPWPTAHRFRTLMHDPEYRLAVAWQNVAYNQPPHPSFFLGDGAKGH